MATQTTVGEYLLHRLDELGVGHLFGVPGDFVLGFFNQVLDSKVQLVGTCNELNAAYAADGYARIRGVGAVSTTYAVGELSAINGVAGAYAERVPVVKITGAPATVHFKNAPLLHHTLGDYWTPLKMFEAVTVASVLLDNAETAPREIDRALRACLEQQRPVYFALPADITIASCSAPSPFDFPSAPASDTEALREAIDEAVSMIDAASSPVIVADVELIRFKLQDALSDLLDATGLPFATLMLGKAVLDEDHPQFIGLYQGDRSRPYVQTRVESADCILKLGAQMTDFNTGGFTVQLDEHKVISATTERIKIRRHFYEGVGLRDFMVALTERLARRDVGTLDLKPASTGCSHRRSQPFEPEAQRAMTIERFFNRLSHFIEDDAVVIAETGLSLFSAAETMMPPGTTFIGQTFYGSIGYTVGGALGAAMANPDRQVVLIIGDGSFQVTCQDLSTMIRYGARPVVFLINNDGYTIERVIVDHDYNDIQPWHYHKLPEIFRGSAGFDVHTEGELEDALAVAARREALTFIEIHTDRLDCSESLRKAGAAMAKANKLI